MTYQKLKEQDLYMASISKNLYIDKLDNMVNKYNNTYHSTIKMKPVDGKLKLYGKLRLFITLEYQNMKTFLKKVALQIGMRRFL